MLFFSLFLLYLMCVIHVRLGGLLIFGFLGFLLICALHLCIICMSLIYLNVFFFVDSIDCAISSPVIDESAGIFVSCTLYFQGLQLPNHITCTSCPSIMTVTVFPSMGDSPDLTLLNTARLFTRLEHNLLSPGSEVRTLRRSEFQRRRITKVNRLAAITGA